MSIKYIRTTHENGIPKKFSVEAAKIWHTTNAGFIGHLLDPIKYMTIEDILDQDVHYEQQEGGEPLSLLEIQEGLDLLVQYNFAAKLEEK